MTDPISISQFLAAVNRLPADPPVKAEVWYLTQKEHWQGWLGAYLGPGAYGRTGTGKRHAKLVYNRVVNAKMLEWLIRASGTRPDLHPQVALCLELEGSMNQQSAAIRALVPWEEVAASLDFHLTPQPGHKTTELKALRKKVTAPMKVKPLENSYWVLPGRFLAGEYPRTKNDVESSARLKAVVEAGLVSFVDLTTTADGLLPYEPLLASIGGPAVHRFSFPIPDISVPGSPQLMTAVLDRIDAELAAGRGVYVHCWGGVGRTGTVVGCWLQRHPEHRPAGLSALQQLGELWKTNPKSAKKPSSPETPDQRRYVETWDNTQLLRAEGALLGQIAGDSLGSLVEFQSPAAIKAKYPGGVRLLADGGTWNTLAGQPTDDSEMALTLARALLEVGHYDPQNARGGYTHWRHSHPFDMGTTVRNALDGRLNPDSQANGALMRVVPLGLFGARHPLDRVGAWAEADAALTHPNRVCLQVNSLFARGVALAIRDGLSALELYRQISAWAEAEPLEPSVKQAVADARTAGPKDYLTQMGWVLVAFQNALYQLVHAPSLEEGVVDTVMRGGDTDTNAAIAGALLGAVYGLEAVPVQWKRKVLNCRPQQGKPGVRQPRPETYWPVDALELAAKLLEGCQSA